MNEIIYILTNAAMPGYVKIGRTANLETRVKDLSRASGVPLPFEVFYAAEVADSAFVEKQLHEAFGGTRVAVNREFFTESPERIVAAIKLCQLREVTPNADIVEDEADREALKKVRRYKKRFDFQRYDIPIGAELEFTRDSNKKVVVADGDNVLLNGEVVSLSKAAQNCLGVDWPAQGPIYWIYEGETLDERRGRMETELVEE